MTTRCDENTSTNTNGQKLFFTDGQPVIVCAYDDHRTARGTGMDVGQPGLHLVHLLRAQTDVIHHLVNIAHAHTHTTQCTATLRLVHLLCTQTDVAHYLVNTAHTHTHTYTHTHHTMHSLAFSGPPPLYPY